MRDTIWYATWIVHQNRRLRKVMPVRSCQRFVEPPRPMRAELIEIGFPNKPSAFPDSYKLMCFLSKRRGRRRQGYKYLSIHLRLAGYKLKED